MKETEMKAFRVDLHEDLYIITKMVRARNAAHAFEVAIAQEERFRGKALDVDKAEVKS